MSAVNAVPWRDSPAAITRANELFERYDLGSVRSPEAMLDRVIAIGGKPITIEKTDDPAVTRTTALWLEFPEYSKILLRSGDRPYYQVRGLYHEFGHIIFGHPGCAGLASDTAQARYAGGSIVRARALLPDDYDPDTEIADAQTESEAEHLASLITRTLLRPIYRLEERVFG